MIRRITVSYSRSAMLTSVPRYGCDGRTTRGGVFFFKQKTAYEIGLGIPAEPLFRSQEMQQQDNHEYPFLYQRQTCHQVQPNQATYQKRQKCQPATYLQEVLYQL